jgi:5-methyltetrahydropteroyltriglutamate--homocysteine methyltransferase
MWFDDYTMGIGSFLWYWYERVGGFGKEKLPHPALDKLSGLDAFVTEEAGGVALSDHPTRGPLRLAALYTLAQRFTNKPIKACVGAGPVQLSTMVHFKGGPIRDRYELSRALAEIFREEIRDLVAAGCRWIQLEDLGAWIPTLSGDKDFEWVREVINATLSGVDAHKSWHFCMGNAWGNKAHGMTAAGYAKVLPEYYDVDVDEFVLDFACREMADAELLAGLPSSKRAAVGVIDVRTLEIEAPEQVAHRIRKVLRYIDPERITITTDCGMKQLPRYVAVKKLEAMVAGTRIVRKELAR